MPRPNSLNPPDVYVPCDPEGTERVVLLDAPCKEGPRLRLSLSEDVVRLYPDSARGLVAALLAWLNKVEPSGRNRREPVIPTAVLDAILAGEIDPVTGLPIASNGVQENGRKAPGKRSKRVRSDNP